MVQALLEAAKPAISPVRDCLGEMLHHLGTESLPPLIAVFVGPDIEFRQFADHELHRWGSLATPALIAALQEPRYIAARPRLAQLLLDVDHAHAKAATPHLLALLQEPDATWPPGVGNGRRGLDCKPSMPRWWWPNWAILPRGCGLRLRPTTGSRPAPVGRLRMSLADKTASARPAGSPGSAGARTNG